MQYIVHQLCKVLYEQSNLIDKLPDSGVLRIRTASADGVGTSPSHVFGRTESEDTLLSQDLGGGHKNSYIVDGFCLPEALTALARSHGLETTDD
jgi:hypothetical protein